MKFAEYCGIDAVNMSTLKQMAVSPLQYRFARMQADRRTSKAFGLGKAIHGAILEPQAFLESAIVSDLKRGNKAFEVLEDLTLAQCWHPYVCDAGSRNSKAYKEAIAQYPHVVLAKEWEEIKGPLQATRDGREVVTQEEMQTAIAVAGAVHAHPVARAMLDGGEAEQTIVWEEDGVKCKGRVDYLSDRVIELKSSSKIEPRAWGFDAVKFRYFEQLAFYCSGSGRDRAGVIVVQSEAPYDVVPYPEVPPAVLDEARRTYKGWIARLKGCEESGEWPGIAPKGAFLELPDKAYGQAVVDDPGLDWSDK